MVTALRLRFEVLHLSDAPTETVISAMNGVRDAFDDAKLDELPDYEVSLRPVYPLSELPERDDVTPKLVAHTVRFSGEVVSDSENVRFYAGLGYLSDLVGLYHSLGEAVFAKNVRSYLYKAHEKGPARYMRDSLNRACVLRKGKPVDGPERFAMLHNGVALVAVNARAGSGELALYDPSVINGCQTVKNAALWLAERAQKPGFLAEHWERVRIPLRVLITRDEELVDDVTISNNRQNAIRASAFRANHKTQLALAERFRIDCQVYYERQEGAFQNLQKTNPRVLEDQYSNSYGKPLKMEELAVAIAVASLKPAISVASKPSDLFEESVYSVIFGDEKLEHLELLIFLRNLLAVMPLVIKDVVPPDPAYARISQGKFAYPCLRVLSRYIVYYKPELVHEFGQKVHTRFPSEDGLRKVVRDLMSPRRTNLKVRLKNHYLEGLAWKSATDQKAMEAILHELDLHDVDTFSTYRNALLP